MSSKRLISVSLSASVLFVANLSSALDTTTTLSEQTSNNTSASSLFTTLSNGDVAPGNVSKVSLKKMLPSGYTGKVLAHWMPWWSCKDGTSGATCNGVHSDETSIDVHYSTEDPIQIDKILEDMSSRGYDGVMVAQSNTGGVDSASTLAMSKEMSKFPDFSFSVGENGLNDVSGGASGQLAQLKADMAYASTHYFNLENYLKMDGRPVVYIFDNGSIDWATASAAIPSNPLFILDGPSHASKTLGGFFWFGTLPNNTDVSSATILDTLDTFLSEVVVKPGSLFSGSFFKGFNDKYASWGSGRIVDQACGLTFVRSLAAVGSTLGSSASSDLPFLQVATWDDYEEGTEVETGIANCGSVAAEVSGTVVTPDPSFSGVGSEETVDHYEVYLSTDGENLMDAGSAATGGGSLDLKSLELASGTYDVFVQMVGKSHIQNQMSPKATMTIAAAAPVSRITVSSPAKGSTVSSPVTLKITVKESFTVARIQVWDKDVKLVDQIDSNSVNTPLKLSAGAHRLVINVMNSSMKVKDTTTLDFTVK
jgi:hypothetical protein